jgi:hypothetical protein
MTYNMQAEGNNGCSNTTLVTTNWNFPFGSAVFRVDAGGALGSTAIECVGCYSAPGVAAVGGSDRGAGVVGIAGNYEGPFDWTSIAAFQFANAGVLGTASDPSAVGVLGQNDVGTGVAAKSQSGIGVDASSPNGVAVRAVSSTGYGVQGTS